MAYIEKGNIKARRSPWRLSIFIDTFWAIIGFLQSFFRTMFSFEANEKYRKKSGGGGSGFGGGPGGGGGGRGPYSGGPGGFKGMDNVRGIDHNSLPACGSCCG